MINKRVIIPLTTIPFLVCSCKGNVISVTTAKSILDNVAVAVKTKSNVYAKFIYSYSSYDGVSSFYKKATYDEKSRYFHYYEITDSTTSENWNYVKNNADGISTIYTCSRLNGAVDKDNNPSVTVKAVIYTEELWNEIKSNIYQDINTYLDRALLSAYKFVDLEKFDNLKCYSNNKQSVVVECAFDNSEHYVDIYNNKVVTYSSKFGEDVKEEFNCDYSTSSIVYLNI